MGVLNRYFYQTMLLLLITLGMGGASNLGANSDISLSEVHTSISSIGSGDYSSYRTFGWDPTGDANSPHFRKVKQLLEQKGYREASSWKEADLVVAFYSTTSRYEKRLPATERLVYGPYGPFYPHSGYYRYVDGSDFGYYEETAHPGYEVGGTVVEVNLLIRHAKERPWSGSGWALTDVEDEAATTDAIIGKILDDF